MKNVYLVGACRTAVGSMGGSLKGIKAADLGVLVIKEALNRAGVDAKDVDEVFMGNVLQAAQGQSPARQMAIKAGVPVEAPATTINKVCGSSLHAVSLAYRTILAGEADCIVAGGAESMSNAPYAVHGMRFGVKMGNQTLVATMINDGLWDAFNNYHMGTTAENIKDIWGITRREQDEFAAASQQKTEAAQAAGRFDDEIVPVPVKVKKEIV